MAIVISGVNDNDKITAADGTIDLLSGVSYASTITAPAFTTAGEISAGHINIPNNIQLGQAGVVTATTFVGNLTGNVNATSNLLLQIGGSEKFRVGGSGQLGIGGANYGTSGQVLTSGGSGSAATWSTITGTTINNNANNRIITGSGTANTLEGEANLTFDGNHLTLNTSSSSSRIYLTSGNSDDSSIYFGAQDDTATGAIRYDHSDDSLRLSGYNNSERLRIDSDGRTLINTTAVTNTNDALTVKRAASGFTEMSMTVDANTATGTHANAFVFTKSKNTYWNGLGFQSSHGHIGAIVGKRDAAGADADQEIRIEIGGTGINASEEKTWNFKNNGNLDISGGHLKLANGYGIDFSATSDGSGTDSSELLDDYEEGTWTPTIYRSNNSGVSGSYNHQEGSYVRVGRLVFALFRVDITSFSGGSGHVVMGGLPYSTNSHGVGGWTNVANMRRMYLNGDFARGDDARSLVGASGISYLYVMNLDTDQWDYGNYTRILFDGCISYQTS